MREKYLEKVPQWYKSNNNYDLVLSDDLDGLLSASILKKVNPNCNIEYFYDFDKLYINKDIKQKENKSNTRVWLDIAYLGTEKCIDNHVSMANKEDYFNRECINPNLMTDVTNSNYYQKYAGSTALVVWSLFNLPLPKTNIGKALLLSIDSTFLGYYYNDSMRERNRFYLCDVLGFSELYELEAKHSESDFKQLQKKLNIKEKIHICNDCTVDTELNLKKLSELLEIELTLPIGKKFDEYVIFTRKDKPTIYINNSVMDINGVTTFAFTGKNKAKYSAIERVIK